MDLFRSFCLLLTVVYAIDADYITEEEYTWSQANKVCTLATPNLNFKSDGITADLDNQFGDDVWLGYVEKMIPFEYFGCAKRSVLGFDAADYITEGDPGQCWSACKNAKAVAVYEHECYCLQNVNTNVSINALTKKRCNIECSSQPKLVCGGYHSDNEYVSLYKTTFTGPIEKNNSDSNICLWYNKAITSFSWGQCTEEYRIICYKDQEVFLYNDGDKYGEWKTMTEKCFNKRGIPSYYNNTMDVDTIVTAQMWTGIIRNAVIYPVTDSPVVMTGKYGYVTKTRKLLFTNSKKVTKRVLCVKGSSSNAGVIVGVTLSIIVVIIAVIVLVVLWKRGIKLPFIQRNKPEHLTRQATHLTYNDCIPHDTIQSTFESSTTHYAELDVSKMSPGKKTTQNDNTNKISDSSDELPTYFVLQNSEDGVYNTTNTSTMRQEQDTFNPYNKLSLENSSNYDHIGTRGESHNKTSATDNPYNTTTLGYSKADYGSTNIAFNKNDESEDTYNHIGDQSCQNGGKSLDNPYNTTS
ncbi:hypothetical protein ACF0H5_012638 [Mactra antiquata]